MNVGIFNGGSLLNSITSLFQWEGVLRALCVPSVFSPFLQVPPLQLRCCRCHFFVDDWEAIKKEESGAVSHSFLPSCRACMDQCRAVWTNVSGCGEVQHVNLDN